RMVERRDDRPGDQARLARELRGRRKEDDRARAVAAVGVKVVFDRADVRVAELVRQRDERERLAIPLRRRLLGRTDVGEELQTEFHDGYPRRRGKRFATLPRAIAASVAGGSLRPI